MATRPDVTTLLDSIDVQPNDLFARYLRDGLRGADLGPLLPPAGPPTAGVPTAPSVAVDLDCLFRVVMFLEALPGVGAKAGHLERRVRRQIALTAAHNALQAVIPNPLVGREREYAALLEYRTSVLATARDWVPSFILVGPGGVGKSALVSKFVSDQRRKPGAPPLIYLDFDRATLIDATPLDLTFEFTRQLGLAESALDQMLAEFRERSRSMLGGQENLNIDIGAGTSSAALRDLASLLSGWPRRTAAVTIVLDTFEEVAIRGVTPVRDVLQWVVELRNTVQLQQIHLVVCGRAVIPDAPHLPPDEVAAMFNVQYEWPLEDLVTDRAVELLTVLGVEPGLARRFPPLFGGNPLVLKLIHRFVTTNDPAEVEQLLEDGEKARRNAPSGEVGLRFVYQRILNRIKTPRVRALAYPGVVLRRVTPELILKVLVRTCPVPST
ncbi:ATP-binding protein [Rhodococcus sp. MTM3W5.2]|uniref:ATP-binding protein n=1 Tax=Rhodococcus sp. MTM3W5.2 TaxID=1805827 RepID=UPI0016749285|nr:ATP-binding protein [Rhodococcus sp. MTM3W5.2]